MCFRFQHFLLLGFFLFSFQASATTPNVVCRNDINGDDEINLLTSPTGQITAAQTINLDGNTYDLAWDKVSPLTNIENHPVYKIHPSKLVEYRFSEDAAILVETSDSKGFPTVIRLFTLKWGINKFYSVYSCFR